MARNFNGSSDRLDFAFTVPASGVYTVACRFKSDVNVPDEAVLIQIQDSSASTQYFRLCIKHDGTSAKPCTRARGGGGASEAYGTTTIAPGTWYLAGHTWISSTSRTLWLNGVNEVTDTNSRTITGINSGTDGAAGDSSPSDYYDGDLAEVAIWDGQLTSDDWLSLNAGMAMDEIKPDKILHYWEILGSTSPEIDTIGGAGATVTGTTAVVHPLVFGAAPAVAAPTPAATEADKSASDNGTFSETSSSSCSLSGTDTANLSEDGQISLAGNDTASLQETSTITAFSDASDTGSLADSSNLDQGSEEKSGNDNGLLIEDSVIEVLLTANETALLAEGAVITTALVGAESGTLIETITSHQVSTTGIDEAGLVETVVMSADITTNDIGNLADNRQFGNTTYLPATIIVPSASGMVSLPNSRGKVIVPKTAMT